MDKEACWAKAEIILKAAWLERFYFFNGARDLETASQILEEELALVGKDCGESVSFQALQQSLLDELAWTRSGSRPCLGHQEEDAQPWGPVIAQQMRGKGRGLVALRDLKRGETVFWQRPAIWVRDSSENVESCAACLGLKLDSAKSIRDRDCGALLPPDVFCCQACQSVCLQFFYEPISTICKDEILRSHVEAIGAVQTRLWSQFPGVINLVLYVLSMFVQEARALGGSTAALVTMQRRGLLPTDARQYMPLWEDLGVPGQDWDSPDARGAHLKELEPHFLSIASAFANLLQEPSTNMQCGSGLAMLFGVDFSLSHLFGQVDTVLMWAGSSTKQGFGVAIVPSVALLNHSCIPNIDTRFSHMSRPGSSDTVLQEGGVGLGPEEGGFWAYLEAKRDIQQGEELTISYVDRSDVLDARQAVLNQFGFSCACARCVLEGLLEAQAKA